MRRIRLILTRSDETVVTFDLAIVREDGTAYEAGPDDRYELFLQGDALMRLYIRDGKKMAAEDIASLMRWIDTRYVPELQLIEELMAAGGGTIH